MCIPMWLRCEPKLVWLWMWGLGIVNFLGLVLLDQIISFFPISRRSYLLNILCKAINLIFIFFNNFDLH